MKRPNIHRHAVYVGKPSSASVNRLAKDIESFKPVTAGLAVSRCLSPVKAIDFIADVVIESVRHVGQGATWARNLERCGPPAQYLQRDPPATQTINPYVPRISGAPRLTIQKSY